MVSYKLLTPEDVYFTTPVPVPAEETDEQKHSSSRLCCKNKSSSTSTAFIALATFLFVVCCVWLIGTIFWLKNPGSQLPHRPPSPSPAAENREGGSGQSPEKCNAIPETHRFDCFPERQPVVTRELCEVRGCCFIQASAVPSPGKDGVPWCFYPPDFPSYTLDSLNDTELGYIGKLIRKQKTYYPRDIESLQLSVMYETDSRLHIKMTFVLKCVFVVLLLNSPAVVTEDGGPDSTPSWLKDVTAVEKFLEEPDVAVIGFFKDSEALGFTDFVTVSSDLSPLTFALCSDPATWEKYHINTSTVSVFRKTDSRHEALELREDRKVDSDAMARFIRINELHYLTEYSDVTAIGIFQSAVSTHLLLFTDRGSKNFTALQRNIRELAPEYRGKVLFVLVDVSLVSNARVLRYFGLESRDTPAVGLYSTENDRKWLLPAGEVTSERVREFCDSALRGELKTEDPKTEGKEAKSEL